MWAPGSPFLLTLDLGHSAADNVTHLQSLGHDQLLPAVPSARDCPQTASHDQDIKTMSVSCSNAVKESVK